MVMLMMIWAYDDLFNVYFDTLASMLEFCSVLLFIDDFVFRKYCSELF